MRQRFKAKPPKVVFVVLRRPDFTDVTPFDTYESARFAVLRYVRKNREAHGIPESWTHEQAWTDWLNRTGENLLIFTTPTWSLEKY